MKKNLVFLISIVLIHVCFSQEYDFVSKSNDSFFQQVSWYKGKTTVLKYQKVNAEVIETKIVIESNKMELFEDSLISVGYRKGLKTKPIKCPIYQLKLSSYKFCCTSPKGDSIFKFSFDVKLFPNSKKEQIVNCGNFSTFSSKKELKNNFSVIDIYASSYLHKGTTIRRLWFNLEKVSRKPFIYFDDNTIMDYNYSANILY